MPEMKNSGVNWLHEIPDNWKTLKLLYCLREPICDGPHETPNYIDSGIPFISVDSLNDSKNINFDIVKKFISEQQYQTYMAKAKLEVGDILFSKAATIGKTAIVSDEKFMIWSPLAVIKNNSTVIDNNFLYYLLNCSELITAIRLSGSYNTQANVGMREMERAIIPVPPLEVQKSIANFLDQKCSEIDSLSADIQSQIDVLEEYKKSVITEAVTKGLNSNVELKNTNFQYWAQIPKNWELKDVKYVFEIVKRIAGKEGYDVLSVTQKGLRVKDLSNNEGQIASDYSNYQFVYPTDYVMNHMDLLTGWVDCSTMFGVTSPDYRVFRLRNKLEHSLDYFKFVLQSCYFNRIFYSLGAGVSNLGRWRLQTESFNNFLFPIPSKEEQDAIAEFLNRKCSEIDSIIADKKAQLEALAGYKKSLIYEYVTGKKEVFSNEF